MVYLDSVYGGPAMHKTARSNPEELLVRVIEQLPDATREERCKAFWEMVREEPEYLRPIVDYFYGNRELAVLGNHPRKRAQAVKDKRESAARIKSAAILLAEHIKSALIGDLFMPNGKMLKDCTFGYCAKTGGVLAAIGRKGKPNEIVGKKLPEVELRKLWK